MGFPSACCEYVLSPLVNKEVVLAYDRAEYSKVGNPRRKEGRVKRHHVAAKGERHQSLISKPQPCGDAQINRNGLI